jgi:hypothetical protein
MPEVVVDARGNNGPLIAAGGGFLLFISLLITWAFDLSAWEAFDLMDIILALIGIAAVVIGGALAMGNPLNVPGGAQNTIYTAGVFAFAVVAFAVLESDELGFGVFLALIGTIAMIVGALQLGRGATAPAAPRTRVAEPPPPPPPPPPSGAV